MTEHSKIPVPEDTEEAKVSATLIERVVRNYDLVKLAPAPIPQELVPPVAKRRRYRRAHEVIEEADSLESLAGQNVVLNIFPSIDTAVCATSVRTFNERAAGLDGTGGVYFVPAFTGLGAPHWDQYARGLLAGRKRRGLRHFGQSHQAPSRQAQTQTQTGRRQDPDAVH